MTDIQASYAGREPRFIAPADDLKVSFEVFPAQPDGPAPDPVPAIARLAPLGPSFVSVTCGAGGGTRDLTHGTARRMQEEVGVPAAAHLTCARASRADVDAEAQAHWDAGIRHIVALRGDGAEPGAPFEPHADGYQGAVDLIGGLKRIAPFEISVAAYPEVHPEARSRAADIDHLWRKVDAGADRALSQFFFSADCFLRFRDEAAARGIGVDIVPGILPITNVTRTRRFAAQCGATIPASLDRMLDGLDGRPAERKLVAATIVADLCMQLHAEGVREFHFYTLNRAELTYAVCHLLGLRPKGQADEQSRAA